VENAAAAHLQAARTLQPGAAIAGRAYFINDLEPVNLWDWINEVLRLSGRPTVSRSISAANAYRLGACCEWMYRLLRLGGEPPMTRFVAQQLAETHTYSVAAAQRDFGYAPPVSPAEAMKRLAGDLRSAVASLSNPPSQSTSGGTAP
jgi:nucleoside-diphosphate-sugar epimerase